jgi:hypothetical protein
MEAALILVQETEVCGVKLAGPSAQAAGRMTKPFEKRRDLAGPALETRGHQKDRNEKDVDFRPRDDDRSDPGTPPRRVPDVQSFGSEDPFRFDSEGMVM